VPNYSRVFFTNAPDGILILRAHVWSQTTTDMLACFLPPTLYVADGMLVLLARSKPMFGHNHP
jgi:hypothetical protein